MGCNIVAVGSIIISPIDNRPLTEKYSRLIAGTWQ
jgi:hypothetical protein